MNKRCRVVAGIAPCLADDADEIAAASLSDQRTDEVDTLTAEIIPLCAALKFIGSQGPKILRTHRLRRFGRPVWLFGIQSEISRDPHGRVLILGAWNYPLLLAGVQAAQALAAGNDVLLKPAVGCEAITSILVDAFYRAGVPRTALQQIDSSTQSAIQTIDDGVDLIVLTGSALTGRAVLRQAAQSLTPTIMELSGCDAAVVLPQEASQLEHTAKSIAFGLKFNSGATCIAPRRLLVDESTASDFLGELEAQLADSSKMIVHPAARSTVAETIETSISQGAVVRLGNFDAEELRSTGQMTPLVLDQVQLDHAIASADLFAPVTSVIRVAGDSQAITAVNQCPYRLAASVFGPNDRAAQVGSQLKVGSVAINDLIVPTADPRVPFGGRGQSGFGVTRGAEGLLAMTVPKVTSSRSSRFAPHLMPRKQSDKQTMLGALRFLHGKSLRERLSGLRRIVNAQRNQTRRNQTGHNQTGRVRNDSTEIPQSSRSSSQENQT